MTDTPTSAYVNTDVFSGTDDGIDNPGLDFTPTGILSQKVETENEFFHGYSGSGYVTFPIGVVTSYVTSKTPLTDDDNNYYDFLSTDVDSEGNIKDYTYISASKTQKVSIIGISNGMSIQYGPGLGPELQNVFGTPLLDLIGADAARQIDVQPNALPVRHVEAAPNLVLTTAGSYNYYVDLSPEGNGYGDGPVTINETNPIGGVQIIPNTAKSKLTIVNSGFTLIGPNPSAPPAFVNSLSGDGYFIVSADTELKDAADFSGKIIVGGGTLEIDSDAIISSSAKIGFENVKRISGSANSTIALDSSKQFSSRIEGFDSGDILDLKDVPYDKNGTITFDGNSLSIGENSTEISILVSKVNSVSQKYFALSDDGKGGTNISLSDIPTISISPTYSAPDGSTGVVVTEGGAAGSVTVTLSSSFSQPINIAATLNPVDGSGHIQVSNFSIPAGMTTWTAPVVTATDDNVVEDTQTGKITFSASTDDGQSVSFFQASGNTSSQAIPLEVYDAIKGTQQTSSLSQYFNYSSKLVSYFSSIYKVSAPFYTLSTAETRFLGVFKQVAGIYGVAASLGSVASDFSNSVNSINLNSDPVTQATALYNAEKTAVVGLANIVAKKAIAGSATLFAVGVLEGLTQGAATPTLPLVVPAVGVGVGWLNDAIYGAWVQGPVSSWVSQQYEANNDKSQFINSFLSNYKPAATGKSAKAVDGYLSGAFVFADDQGTGVFDPTDPWSITDDSGSFNTPSDTTRLNLSGGVDVETGLPFSGTLTAPAGSTVITPLTTLVDAVMQQNGTTVADAQAQVETALGISGGTDLTTLDPIANATTNQAGAAAPLGANSQLANTAAILSAAGASSTLYALLAGQIQASASTGTPISIDLTSSATLEALAIASGLGPTVASDIAAIASASNSALAQFAQTDTGSTLLSDVAAVSKTAQGITASALQAAGDDPTQLQAVVAANTGANLNAEIAQAQASLSGGSTSPGQGSSVSDGGASAGGSTVSTGSTGPGTPTPTGSSLPGITTVSQPVASTLSGGQASTTRAEAPVQPFAGVSLANPNASGTDTVTIVLSGAGGTLSDGPGFSGLTRNPDGSFTLTGPTAAVSVELNALVFNPAAGSLTGPSTTTFMLSDTNSAGLTTTSAPISVSDIPADTLASAANFAGHGVFTISGQATSPSGIVGIELFADVDGQRTDLGAATVSPDSSFTFTDRVAAAAQSNITAIETNGAGETTTTSIPFDLTTGIKGQPYTAEQDTYDPATGAYTGSSYYGRDGSLVYASTYTANPDGTQTYAYTGGSYFDSKPYSSYADTYDADGNLLTEVRTRNDGATVTSIGTPGQTLSTDGSGDDVFRAGNQGSNTFVFTPGFGQALITGFNASSFDHDTLALPASDFTNIADVLRNTQNVGDGVVITDSTTGDAIRLAGVSKADLTQHKHDFALG